MTHLGNPIVVGTDGSDGSMHAISWAAAEATSKKRSLRLVYVFSWPLLDVPPGPTGYGLREEGLHRAAQEFLTNALAHARTGAPDVDVSGEVLTGAVVSTLVAESRDADLLVIGNRGLGGFAGMLVGSVGVGIAAHAHCPVVVVRPPAAEHGVEPGRVVVGVDGSPQSELALSFAFDEADRRGHSLTAVHTWTAPTSVAPGDMLPLVYDVDLIDQEETRLLAELLAGWREKHPDVQVQHRVAHARPAPTLIEESKTADLLVVGSRGRGGFRGLLLGSVSQAVMHHAACPVAVVRENA